MKDISVKYEKDAEQLARQLFGRSVADDELAAAVGALDGAALEVSVRMNGQELHVAITHPLIAEQRRGFRRDATGNLYIWNHRFDKRVGAPPGVGLASFKRQIEGARQLGVKRIELYAAGNRNDTRDVGYLVWAIFGFEAKLTDQDKLLLPPQLRGLQTVNEVIGRGGRAWWAKHGTSRKMVFDLNEDSSMMKTLNSYLNDKGLTKE